MAKGALPFSQTTRASAGRNSKKADLKMLSLWAHLAQVCLRVEKTVSTTTEPSWTLGVDTVDGEGGHEKGYLGD